MRSIIVAILLLLIVSGCGYRTASNEIIYVDKDKEARIDQLKKEFQEKQYTIAIVPKVSGIPYYSAIEQGAREASRDLGVNLLFADSPGTTEGQIEVIEDLILKQVDAIAISATDPFKLLPTLQKARSKGIKIVTLDSDTDHTGRDFFVNMVDSEALGRHLMDSLASTINEKGEYAIITGSLSSSNTNEWIKWMKIQQKEYYPEMKLVRIVASNDNFQHAYEDTKTLLKEYPKLSAIIGVSSVAPPAAAKAVMEKSGNGVEVLGLSLPNSMRNYIESGVTDTITLWSPQKLGYLTVALTKNLLDGEFPLDQQEVPNVGNIRVKDNVVIMGEPIIFTKDNIEQYDF